MPVSVSHRNQSCENRKPGGRHIELLIVSRTLAIHLAQDFGDEGGISHRVTEITELRMTDALLLRS